MQRCLLYRLMGRKAEAGGLSDQCLFGVADASFQKRLEKCSIGMHSV